MHRIIRLTTTLLVVALTSGSNAVAKTLLHLSMHDARHIIQVNAADMMASFTEHKPVTVASHCRRLDAATIVCHVRTAGDREILSYTSRVIAVSALGIDVYNSHLDAAP